MELYHSKGTESDLAHFISVLSGVLSQAFNDKSVVSERDW